MRRMLLVVCALAGCPSEPPPECITVDTACQPGYVPTFENVYKNTMREGCGSTRSACHAASGEAALSFADQATAHAQLVAEGHVTPGNAACSEFIVRTSSPGADYQMPPGDALTPEARCALIQWVQMGALP